MKSTTLPALLDDLATNCLEGRERLQTWLADEADIKGVAKLAKQLSAAQDSLKKCRDGETLTLAMQNEYASAKLRCQRRGGQLLKAMDKHKGAASKRGATLAPRLQERLGTDTPEQAKHISSRWQKIADVSDEDFETLVDVDAQTEADEEITAASVLRKSGILANKFTGETEWYTPKEWIERARQTMGSIDCDPASSALAQKVVRAATFYDVDDDGLQCEWHGNVWLNPPYKHPDVANFANALCDEFEDGTIKQAILLVNNVTDTKWFHRCLSLACAAFTAGRISFYNANGESSAPTNGQVFFYFGHRQMEFVEAFGGTCTIVKKI